MRDHRPLRSAEPVSITERVNAYDRAIVRRPKRSAVDKQRRKAAKIARRRNR